MTSVRLAFAAPCLATFSLAILLAGDIRAQTVWSGLTFEFTKSYLNSYTLPENQDRITDNVWLTRATQMGIFNIAQEDFYDQSTHTAPADTEWATDLMLANEGEAIAASNWQDLTFTNWIQAYGGPGSQDLPNRLVGRNAVVHLITDDIYLDLQFTDWTLGAGGFEYIRAVGDLPPPTTTGDYNQNGIVDAADYVLWRSTLDQPASPAGSGADGNSSGTIDAGDYDYWAERFGNIIVGAGGGSLTLAVPEPSAAWLLLLAAPCLFPSSRNRCRS